jgi:RHS repeat-associated protein
LPINRLVNRSVEDGFNGDSLVATVDQQTAGGAATGTPQTLYIHPDHLGSTNVVTNASGTVVTTKDYYPYGSMRVNSGSASLARGYIGQFADQSNLSYLEARYYDPARGQFLSQDPTYLAIGNPSAVKGLSKVDQNMLLTDPQALNSYSYALNNPIRFRDKDGKFVDIPWVSNSRWAQEGATAAYQQSSVWRFAMDHPNTTAAIVGVSSIPALMSGGSAAAAFQMAAYPGVGTAFAAQQAFAGAVYSALTLESTFGIPGVVGQFSQLNTRQPTSIFGPAGSLAGVGLSAWGGYPGAIADAFQFGGLLNRTLGSSATNLFSNSVQSRIDTARSFNTSTGGSGSGSSSGGGGSPSPSSLWVTPSGAVVTFGGQLVAPPPSK